MGGTRIAVAMSGGVDSSVAAALLVKQGFDVVGVHMKLFDNQIGLNTSKTCCSALDSKDAKKVCNRLGIPFFVFDMRDVFYQKVVLNFIEEYKIGRTPNPCIHCNSEIKNEYLFREISKIGCTILATGHYARIVRNEPLNKFQLRKAFDAKKDQTYFLFQTPAEKLSTLSFPLGETLKSEVRTIAKELGLPTAEKQESQEICFIDNDYRNFLNEQEKQFFSPGEIKNKAGKVVGKHTGVANYTIGQRKGLGISNPTPLYVISLDIDKNEVIVGGREDAFSSALIAEKVNWIENVPEAPFEAVVKIRYSHEGQRATITQINARNMKIDFHQPVFGITPGQAAVVYKDDLLLGGGWIASRSEN